MKFLQAQSIGRELLAQMWQLERTVLAHARPLAHTIPAQAVVAHSAVGISLTNKSKSQASPLHRPGLKMLECDIHRKTHAGSKTIKQDLTVTVRTTKVCSSSLKTCLSGNE